MLSLPRGQTFSVVASRGLNHTGEPSREQNKTGEALASIENGFVAFECHNVLHMLGMMSMMSMVSLLGLQRENTEEVP